MSVTHLGAAHCPRELDSRPVIPSATRLHEFTEIITRVFSQGKEQATANLIEIASYEDLNPDACLEICCGLAAAIESVDINPQTKKKVALSLVSIAARRDLNLASHKNLCRGLTAAIGFGDINPQTKKEVALSLASIAARGDLNPYAHKNLCRGLAIVIKSKDLTQRNSQLSEFERSFQRENSHEYSQTKEQAALSLISIAARRDLNPNAHPNLCWGLKEAVGLGAKPSFSWDFRDNADFYFGRPSVGKRSEDISPDLKRQAMESLIVLTTREDLNPDAHVNLCWGLKKAMRRNIGSKDKIILSLVSFAAREDLNPYAHKNLCYGLAIRITPQTILSLVSFAAREDLNPDTHNLLCLRFSNMIECETYYQGDTRQGRVICPGMPEINPQTKEQAALSLVSFAARRDLNQNAHANLCYGLGLVIESEDINPQIKERAARSLIAIAGREDLNLDAHQNLFQGLDLVVKSRDIRLPIKRSANNWLQLQSQ